MKELEGILIYKYVVFPTRNPLDFCYFPDKFGTHLQKEFIYNKIFLIQIVLKLTTEILRVLNIFNCRMSLTFHI